MFNLFNMAKRKKKEVAPVIAEPQVIEKQVVEQPIEEKVVTKQEENSEGARVMIRVNG